jgi:hypothetical protein
VALLLSEKVEVVFPAGQVTVLLSHVNFDLGYRVVLFFCPRTGAINWQFLLLKYFLFSTVPYSPSPVIVLGFISCCSYKAIASLSRVVGFDITTELLTP